MRGFHVFLLTIGVFLLSLLTAVPVVRVYNQYFPIGYGSGAAFGIGAILSFYFFTGLVFGLFHQSWHRSFFKYMSVVLLLFAAWAAFANVREGVELLILATTGYIFGYVIRELIKPTARE